MKAFAAISENVFLFFSRSEIAAQHWKTKLNQKKKHNNSRYLC